MDTEWERRLAELERVGERAYFFERKGIKSRVFASN
jgi:hypothetical protein